MILPSLEYEQTYWQQGLSKLAGIDEAGMGALAGPVVAAAVVLNTNSVLDGVRDSKLLSAQRRAKLASVIQDGALTWAIGEASVEEITRLNIRRAAHLAMQRAVDQLTPLPELLLIDGNPCQPHPTIPAITIVDGDALSISIAAASILAKVHRDKLMATIHEQYPVYGFAGHKGYGSATHMAALREYGVCPIHRPSYAPIAAAIQQHKGSI